MDKDETVPENLPELETELERARSLDVDDLADAIETIGFECTRCGGCCKSIEDDTGTTAEHTATVFPDEIRQLVTEGYDWRDVARPMPYGLTPVDSGGNGGPGDDDGPESDGGPNGDDRSRGDDGPESDGGPNGDVTPEPTGETFEWALQTDCGDCTFYREVDGLGECTVHENRPLVCRTYPFSVALGGTGQPLGAAVDREGMVRAHECEGLGRDIDRAGAEDLAAALKERAVRELEEAIAIRDSYEPAGVGGVVVHDSEGAKRPDGTSL